MYNVMMRTGSQMDPTLAAQLRAAVQERGALAISEAIGVSPIALASACAGSHVVGRTAERVRAFLARRTVMPDEGVTPGRIT